MKALLAIIVASAAAGCVSRPNPPAMTPSAALNETAVVDGVAIRPLALLEDSRCPERVQCVWAGRVRIRAMISPRQVTIPAGPNAPTTAVAREIDMTQGQPVVEFGRALVLSSVYPAPLTPGIIEPRAYRFTFAAAR